MSWRIIVYEPENGWDIHSTFDVRKVKGYILKLLE